MKRAPTKPIPEDLKDEVFYDPDTGVFTRLRGSDVGKRAGTVFHPTGVQYISIHNVSYLGHRLAWFYMTGQQPPPIVDHIDGDPGNNRWANLRPATASQNCFNTRRRRDGLKGAYKATKGGWQAAIKAYGKNHYLGAFATEEEAAAAYAAKAVELHGKFARFSE